jgi:titin
VKKSAVSMEGIAMNGLRRISDNLVKAAAAGGLLLATALPFALASTAGATTLVPLTPPAAPTGVTASSGIDTQGIADATINISWNASVNTSNNATAALGYNVYEGTTAGGESTTPVNGVVPIVGTSLNVPALTDGTTYFFTVASVNALGQSVSSAEVSDAPAGIPSAPLTPKVTNGNGQATLSWSAPAKTNGSAVVGYNVYVTTTAPNATTGVDTYVTALNTATAGSWLNANGGVSGSNSPACPQSFTVDGFVPFNGPECTALEAFSSANLVTGTTETVTGLTNGTPYYFVVTAVNGVGESQGALASNTAATPGTITTAPASFTASAVTGTSVTLTWAAESTATVGFNIFEGSTSGAESATPINVAPIANNPAGNTYTVSGLTSNTTYYFDASALNSVGSSLDSSEVAAVTTADVPGAPTGVTATPLNGTAEVFWTAPASNGGAPITDYYVEYSLNGGQTWTAGLDTSFAGAYHYTFPASTFTNGIPVEFRVYAVNGITGNTLYSAATAAVTPNYTVPLKIKTLSVSIANTTNVATLSWTAPNAEYIGGLSGYNIYVGSTSGGETLAATAGPSVTSTTVQVGSAGLYFFEVAATNALGTAVMSNEASATAGATYATGAPSGVAASINYSDLGTGVVGSTDTGARGDAFVSYTASSADGGATVTSYNVYRLLTTVGAAITAGPLGTTPPAGPPYGATPYVDTAVTSVALGYLSIGGLAGGTSYTFFLVPVNSYGASDGNGTGNIFAASVPFVVVGPSLSQAPTGAAETQTGNSMTVNWSAPVNLDGTTADGYQVSFNSFSPADGTTPVLTGVVLYACPATIVGPCISSPTIGTNIVSGTSAVVNFAAGNVGTYYDFFVQSTNDEMSWFYPGASTDLGAASSASLKLQLAGPPSFTVNPTLTMGAANSTLATVTRGTVTGGTVTKWTATSNPGGITCSGTTDTSCTLVGLTEGTYYTVTVSVTTTTGTLAYTTLVPLVQTGKPIAATGVTASAVGTGATNSGQYAITVSWTEGANGGSALLPLGSPYFDNAVTEINVKTFASSNFFPESAIYYDYSVVHGANYTAGTIGADLAGTPTAASLNAAESLALADILANGLSTNVCVATAAYLPGGVDFSTATSTETTNLATTATTSCTIYGVTVAAPTQLTFIVTEDNANGATSSAYALPVTLTLTGTVPGAPSTVAAAVVGSQSVQLTWNAPLATGGSTILGYNVLVGTTKAGESTTPANGATLIPFGTNTVTLPGLTNGTKYYFVVEAVNANGSSAASKEVHATPVGSPGTPVGITATPSGANSVALTWSAPAVTGGSTIAGYLVYAGTAVGGESATPINSTLITGTTYTAVNLNKGVTYYFVVVADNGFGFSNASPEVSSATGGALSTDVPVVTAVAPSLVPTFSASFPVSITGVGFDQGMTAKSSNAAFTVSVADVATAALTGLSTAVVLVSTTSAATTGTSATITLTNPNGLTGTFALNGGVTSTSAMKITSRSGSATRGKTTTIVITGRNFPGRPSVTSNAGGTRVSVVSASSTRIVLRVTASRAARTGVHTLTLVFSNGSVAKVNYSTHA